MDRYLSILREVPEKMQKWEKDWNKIADEIKILEESFTKITES